MADTAGTSGLSTVLVAFLAAGGVGGVIAPVVAARRSSRLGPAEKQDLVSRVAKQLAEASGETLAQQRQAAQDAVARATAAETRAARAETAVADMQGRVEKLEDELRWYRGRYGPRPEGETA